MQSTIYRVTPPVANSALARRLHKKIPTCRARFVHQAGRDCEVFGNNTTIVKHIQANSFHPNGQMGALTHTRNQHQ